VDTGSDTSVIPQYLFKQICGETPMEAATVEMRAYGDFLIPVIGSVQMIIHTSEGEVTERLQITKQKKHLILGRELSEKINYVSFPPITPPVLDQEPQKLQVHQVKQKEDIEVKVPEVKFNPEKKEVTVEGQTWKLPITKEQIQEDFQDVFKGLGTLPGGPYQLKLKPGVEPVQHPPRRVPEKRKEAFKAELERLVNLKVIKKVEGHTDWINSIVPADKEDGSLRLCLDPRDLNEALQRNPYHMKTMEEISAELFGAEFFTLVDAATGFWHVPLEEKSSFLTTFNTPWGKYRFLRLPFGLKTSSDVFQQRLEAVLNKLHDVTGIADDCLAKGKTEEEHDVALLTLLQAARMNGIKFNLKKMQFKTKQCAFFGQLLTPEGFKQDPKKIQAITSMEAPRDRATLESFLGMVNYMKRFSVELSQVTKPLRDLLKQGVIFSWESTQEEAFQKVKKIIAKTPVLTYFNPKAQHTIQTDASLQGLGAVLLQEGKPVTFVSRSLLPAEKHYSSLERELLGVEFGLRRLYNFTHGETVTVQTDHKPLVSMFNREVGASTPRQQRLLLKIHSYDVTLEYLKGKQNVIADALSRVSPLPPQEEDLKGLPVISMKLITSAVPATETKLQKIRQATSRDAGLSQVATYIHHGWPQHKTQCPQETHPFWNYKEELSLEAGLIYKGSRLVIPESEKASILEALHAGHLGEEKTLLRARESVYWTGITEDVKLKVKTCDVCQKYRPSQQKEPLLPHEVPSSPWIKLGMDYFDLKGSTYLLIADYFSRFPIVRRMKNMTAAELVTVCKTVFSEQGFPMEIVSDQGTQFTSQEFKKLAAQYDIKLTNSSPRYPQSNGFAEAMVQVVKKLMTKAIETGEDPHISLLIYRTTPLRPGLASPADLMKDRKWRDLLPVKQVLSANQEKVRESDLRIKEQQVAVYDRHAKARQELEDLQKCRVQLNPHQPIWTPATVIQPVPDKPRSYIVQTPEGQRFERNRRFLKPMVEQPNQASQAKQQQQGSPSKAAVPPVPEPAVVPALPSPSPSPTPPPPKPVSSAPPKPRRSSRATRKPERLIDTM
jgi:transposase InsO family protein